ncbi:MAG TPA: RidA family protein [Candidatus Acidoferrales bacterium]|nr:RidA family protein [Candidatus Acidoferrales bacterium]
MRIRLVLALMLFPVICFAQQNRRYFSSEAGAKLSLPFSSGVRVGDVLYIAGTTGVTPGTSSKSVNPEEEARLVMEQVKHVVEQGGMAMDDIVSVQVFCTDLKNYDAFNRVYRMYFHGHYPARAFIGASQLLFGARYEVMGIAVRRQK